LTLTLAFIGGTGQQGFGLALRFAAAGYPVVIGSRESEKAARAAEEACGILREHGYDEASVEGAVNEDAASVADVVFLTVPFFALIDTVKGIEGGIESDDVVVDVTVPLETNVGGKPTRLIRPWAGSSAETVAELLPDVSVVSAFENVSAAALRKLDEEVDCDVVVCSDDDEAKRLVMDLAEEIPGVRAIDGGPLENARIVESITALLIGLNMRYGKEDVGVRFTNVP